MQVMLMSLAREEMKNEIMKKYEALRKTWRDSKPRDLNAKLAEIEKQEARHLELFEHDNVNDDRAMLVSLPGSGFVLDGDEQKGMSNATSSKNKKG